MKKFVSLLLCMLFVFGAMSVTSWAAEPSKTEKFISDVKSSKSIEVKISDESIAKLGVPVKIKNVSACIVDGKIGASATVFGFLKAKVVVDNGNISAYVPGLFCKADITAIMGGEPMDTSIIDGFWDKLGTLTDYFDNNYLKLQGSASENGLTVETYIPDLVEIVKGEFASAIEPGTDVTQMSVQEIINLLNAADPQAGAKIALWAQANAKFYYDASGALVNIVIKMPNEAETALETTDVSALVENQVNLKIESISTNVSASKVAPSAAIFNITGLVKSILGSFLK